MRYTAFALVLYTLFGCIAISNLTVQKSTKMSNEFQLISIFYEMLTKQM